MFEALEWLRIPRVVSQASAGIAPSNMVHSSLQD
jgi:hypothetical protein